jgi:hypothetical protein
VGVRVSATTVAKILRKAGLPPADARARLDLRCVDALIRVLGRNVAALSWNREARLSRAG